MAGCKRHTCTGYTKGSQYTSQCRRCVGPAGMGTRCYQHPGVPGKNPRKPDEVATVGHGVQVRPTPTAGNGLFAVWAFRKNDLITEYSGVQLSKQQAIAELVQTHIAPQAHGYTYVSGLRQPVVGQGGGSFANHTTPPNAELAEVNNRLFLKAKKPIQPGEEITLSYGKEGSLSYRVAMNINGARFT